MKNTFDQFTTPADVATSQRTRAALLVAHKDKTLAQALNDGLAALFLFTDSENELDARVAQDAYNALYALSVEASNREQLRKALLLIKAEPLIEVGTFSDEELEL